MAECVFADKGVDGFYSFTSEVFTKKDLSKEGLLAAAEVAGTNRSDMETCFDEGKYATEVQAQMALGQRLFKVSGTPGNVVLNFKTKERKLVS